MEKKLDLRIQKTYLALEEAFTKLLEEKPFEAITTNELCDTAMIRRTTFYKHFADKYDYFDFYVSSMMERSRNNVSIELLKTDPVTYTELRIKEHLDFMLEHKNLLKNFKNSTMFAFYYQSILRQLEKELRDMMIETGNYSPSPEIDFSIYLYSGALLSGIVWWLENPAIFSERELAQTILKTIPTPYATNFFTKKQSHNKSS